MRRTREVARLLGSVVTVAVVLTASAWPAGAAGPARSLPAAAPGPSYAGPLSGQTTAAQNDPGSVPPPSFVTAERSPGTRRVTVTGLAADAVRADTFTERQWRQMAGSLSGTDKALLVKVRQAGLWEIPVSRLAQTQAASPRVRRIGAVLSNQHLFLDQQVQLIAAKLGRPLPGQPNPQQQVFLQALQQVSGTAFDAGYTNDLRFAHGQVFAAIAKVRTSTRNPVIRIMANTANDFVSYHMKLLEWTTLVDWDWVNARLAAGTANLRPLGDVRIPVSDRVVYGGIALLALVAVATVALRSPRPSRRR